MNVLVTLSAGLGADLGPNFNLTADIGTVAPSTATKSELLAGVTVAVNGSATEVVVTSDSNCTNSITIPITA